ncbi:uncharacterized protein HHUB_1186 [Halobacterium hubeiense]|uniref:Uncharacterized protein n=2 Tax=Halobacterium hubeiense TaxID=1407499 RepID=A0A0U5GZR5_9EURY|nr:hypothetical protein [Halobacterium hubeiense]CQH46014.1 uncharacterized protein HHUB_1186 [Halobacterium hubeiense]
MPEPPTPPTGLPDELVDSLEACSPEQLRQVATYADELATYRDEEPTETVAEPEADDRPDAVPAKATITVKEINDNRYYYWQWRDGEHVHSAYKGPVTPDG